MSFCPKGHEISNSYPEPEQDKAEDKLKPEGSAVLGNAALFG